MASSKNSNHKNGSKKYVAPVRASASNHNAPARKVTAATTVPAASAQKGHRPVMSTTVEAKPADITCQQIAEAAYFLWKERGGSEIVNWLEAEHLLRSRAPAKR